MGFYLTSTCHLLITTASIVVSHTHACIYWCICCTDTTTTIWIWHTTGDKFLKIHMIWVSDTRVRHTTSWLECPCYTRCINVFMYVCMHVYMYAGLFACKGAERHACKMHAHDACILWRDTYARTDGFLVCMHLSKLYVHMHVHLCMHELVMYAFMYLLCMHVHMYVSL